MSIDRADWHYESAEKEYYRRMNLSDDCELSNEQVNEIWLCAANHIGLFLRWIIENGFEGEESDPEGTELVRKGKISGSEYLMEYCDGKFWESDVREDILPFVEKYYEKAYLSDYGEAVLTGDTQVYGALSGKKEYKSIKKLIDKAYKQYKSKK
ncbi:hypothetical protein [Ruminococcus sp. Marseille-P6503]|uniref:DUF7832 domain-containing protein n=1 Tax=Ruminococcus sp. Marseille-P6503 TaxID=2364796 RepID=UPI000F5212FD|nr:hypothetical protein [Ruminococcus sp. Marseille-P6503]